MRPTDAISADFSRVNVICRYTYYFLAEAKERPNCEIRTMERGVMNGEGGAKGMDKHALATRDLNGQGDAH